MCVHMCVSVCVGVCNIHTYIHACIHTRMITFLFIMICKFVNKMYIISHDMRKNLNLSFNLIYQRDKFASSRKLN